VAEVELLTELATTEKVAELCPGVTRTPAGAVSADGLEFVIGTRIPVNPLLVGTVQFRVTVMLALCPDVSVVTLGTRETSGAVVTPDFRPKWSDVAFG
jgi:hypothetical protein